MTPMTEAARRRSGRSAAGSAAEWALWCLVPLLVAGSTMLAILLLHRPIPQADYWDHINWLRGMEQTGFRFADLFRQANEHRIALPRLVYRADDALFRSTGMLCLAVIALSAAAFPLLHWRLYRPLLDTAASRGFAVLVLTALGLLFTQSENFLWENQVQFLFVYLFAMVGILGAVRAAEAGAGRFQAMAVAGLEGATWSMANGVLAFIPVIILFVWHRRWRTALAYTALAGVTLAAYLAGYVRPPYHPSPLASLLNHPGAVVLHFLVTLGGIAGVPGEPVGDAARAIMAGLGAAGAAYALWRGARRLIAGRPAGTAESVSLLFILYILGSLALTSLGRAEISVDQGLASRYQTPVLLFWINLLLLLLTDPALPAVRRRGPLAVLAAVIAVFALSFQTLAIDQAAARAARLGLAMDAVAAGVPDAPALQGSFPVTEVPLTFSDILRRQGRSLFTDPDYARLGARLDADTGGALPLMRAAAVAVGPAVQASFAGTVLLARFNGAAEGGAVEGLRPVTYDRPVFVIDACRTILGFGRLSTGYEDPANAPRFAPLSGGPVHLRAYLAEPLFSRSLAAGCAAPEAPGAQRTLTLVLRGR